MDLVEETSFGHCRCCLEEGLHRDITKMYQWNGINEIYADIFLDCFNVFLSTNTNLSSLICTSCVSQLRVARDFKALVLRTEEQLMDALQDSYGERMVLVNVPVPKETLDTTIGFKIEVHKNYEDSTLTNHNKEVITPDIPDQQTGTLKYDGAAPLTGQHKLKSIILDPKKREKLALLANTFTLLDNCNATLFKSKMRAGFPCFYCRDIFDNLDLLRSHQMADHAKSNLMKILKMYSAEALVVYADVKDLKCTLCDESMPSLKELKNHLASRHKKRFSTKVTDRVVPFKLTENYYECQICSFNFETFGAIERHMNTHYRNYVCNVCDSAFVTMVRLKTHNHFLHKEGSYQCDYCVKVFKTQLRLKVHVDFVHKMLKKLKCPKCPERFSDYFVQKKHMVNEHGEVPIVYRCNVCSKAFNRRYTLSCHMKRHLEQKDVECDLCSYACYNKAELREHMLKHNKQSMEKDFVCTICDKSYTRKKTLKEHMRLHTDDRRYVCNICEQAFIQINSLRTHMRNHHKEYNSD